MDAKQVLNELQEFLDGMCYHWDDNDIFVSWFGFCLKRFAEKIWENPVDYGTNFTKYTK